MNFNSLIDKSIQLSDDSKYYKALSILFECLDRYLEHRKSKGLSVIYCHIASNFQDLNQFNSALEYYNLGLKENENDELSSLGKYVVLIDLDKSEEAIKEMFRFLKSNSANLYKATLEELLEGLEMGYMTDYERQIRELANENDVVIVPGTAN